MGKLYTLGELAALLSVELHGDATCKIDHVAPLEAAQAGALAFLANKRYRHYLQKTQASAVILAAEHVAACPVPALISENPYALYAKAAALLHPLAPSCWRETTHPTAVVHASARLAAGVQIDPCVVIEAGVQIGENCVIGAGSFIGRDSKLGNNTRLAPNVTLYDGCVLGARVRVHAGTVIGSDGFGYANEAGTWLKIPQVGRVLVGDDVEIGAGVTIDRGANRDTIIENGVILDNIIHIAHNVRIGAHTAIAAMSGIAGSSIIGSYCTIGGRTSIVGHVNIPDHTHINSCSVVTHSIIEAGSYASGTPLEPSAHWRRNWVRFKQLDEMAKRIKVLETKLNGNTDCE